MACKSFYVSQILVGCIGKESVDLLHMFYAHERSIINTRLHITVVSVIDQALSFANNLQESPPTLGLDIAMLLLRKQNILLHTLLYCRRLP